MTPILLEIPVIGAVYLVVGLLWFGFILAIGLPIAWAYRAFGHGRRPR